MPRKKKKPEVEFNLVSYTFEAKPRKLNVTWTTQREDNVNRILIAQRRYLDSIYRDIIEQPMAPPNDTIYYIKYHYGNEASTITEIGIPKEKEWVQKELF